MDFPTDFLNRPVISPWSPESLGPGKVAIGGTGVPASGTWPTAARGVWIPFRLKYPFLIRLLWWANGTSVAGTVDVGIYTGDETTPVRLLSSGPTTQAGTSICQSVDVSDYLLMPGSYYMAMAMSSASGHCVRCTYGTPASKLAGIAEMASVSTLPATATLITAANIGLLPLYGICSRTLI